MAWRGPEILRATVRISLRGRPLRYIGPAYRSSSLRSFGADPATVMLAAAVAVAGTGLAERAVPWIADLGFAVSAPPPPLDDGPVTHSAVGAGLLAG